MTTFTIRFYDLETGKRLRTAVTAADKDSAKVAFLGRHKPFAVSVRSIQPNAGV